MANNKEHKVILHNDVRLHDAKIIKNIIISIWSLTTRYIFIRLCSFRLSLISIDAAQPCWLAKPHPWRVRAYSRSRNTLTSTLPHSRRVHSLPSNIQTAINKLQSLGRNGKLLFSNCQFKLQLFELRQTRNSRRTSFFFAFHSALKSAFLCWKRCGVTIWRNKKYGSMEWIASKEELFFYCGIHLLPKKYKKVIVSGKWKIFWIKYNLTSL